MNKKQIKTYDIDGVINLDSMGVGIRPSSPDDIIITGRSFEESKETMDFLESNGIFNKVFFNTVKFDDKTRESSGQHKGRIISELLKEFDILCHYEDDEIQMKEIQKMTNIKVIHVNHKGLIELENVKR